MKTLRRPSLILRSFVLLAAWIPWSVAAVAADVALERELRELLDVLPGYYSGEVRDPSDPTGTRRMTLFHKIVRIEAPQFGETVFYHQISRDGFDSLRPAQQKIYAFDRNPTRRDNRMRSWVFYPNQQAGNLERSPTAIAALQADSLMNFPPECAIRWQRGEQANFIARVQIGRAHV